MVFCDNISEFLAGANTVADHITVLDHVPAQIP